MPPIAPSKDRLGRELEHFDGVAARDSETILGWNSPAGQARAERRARLFVTKGGIGPGRRVLELGCGTGEFTRRVVLTGAEVVALDLSGVLLSKARIKVGAMARFARCNAEALPFRDEAFDVVYGCSILHHLNVEVTLQEIRRVLRRGGQLVFSEPNLANPQVLLIFKCKSMRARYGASPDEMAFTRRVIMRMLRRAGFRRFAVTHFDFLHPSIPAWLLPFMEPIAERLERVPLLRTISGSMLIHAEC